MSLLVCTKEKSWLHILILILTLDVSYRSASVVHNLAKLIVENTSDVNLTLFGLYPYQTNQFQSRNHFVLVGHVCFCVCESEN